MIKFGIKFTKVFVKVHLYRRKWRDENKENFFWILNCSIRFFSTFQVYFAKSTKFIFHFIIQLEKKLFAKLAETRKLLSEFTESLFGFWMNSLGKLSVMHANVFWLINTRSSRFLPHWWNDFLHLTVEWQEMSKSSNWLTFPQPT